MGRESLTKFGCFLGVALMVGCASRSTNNLGLSLDSLPPPVSELIDAPNSESPHQTATTQKPVVRNQNNGFGWGGEVDSSGADLSRQPMPVSGQTANPIGTTPDNSYNALAQFNGPSANSQSNPWSNSPQTPTTQPSTGQPWPQVSAPPPGYRPPPPAGYPGAPDYPASPDLTPSQSQFTPAGNFGPPTNNQPRTPAYGSAPQSGNAPYGRPTFQPPTSFTSVRPPQIPITGAPASTGVPPNTGVPSSPSADGNWEKAVPRVGQLPSTVSSPPPSQGYLPQPATPLPLGGPPTFGGSPPQTSDVSPPVGGWPQAFGAPQPPATPGGIVPPSEQFADVVVNVQETQTGRFMLGAAVNSDAGLTGQIVIDEQNFDCRRWPTSFDDALSGKAFRGGGQRLRIEAMPGDEVQRYMIQFAEPYLGGTRISFNLSGYYFDRRYFDWDEQRLGGRAGLGYRITPELSLAGGLRAERVTISDPRVMTVPELNEVLGRNELYSGNISLTQDTRDISFAPTQGYYLRFSYDQVFGSYDYGRGEIDWRKYFLVTERPDGSGRQVLSFSNRFSLSGDETPIFENFFAGGHATLRGFEFRGASPEIDTVTVGGRLMFLGSVEYLFPITADDMLKAVVFCDYGTVEEDTDVDWDDFRLAFGAGLRVSIPAMGPAPIALDVAVPVNRENTDNIQNFSFFVGYSR